MKGEKPSIPLTCCMFDKIHSENREQHWVKCIMDWTGFLLLKEIICTESTPQQQQQQI